MNCQIQIALSTKANKGKLTHSKKITMSLGKKKLKTIKWKVALCVTNKMKQ